jgi:hypothetical protein
MKKIFVLILGIILFGCLSCCSNSDKQNFYGTYTFNEVSYLSGLSSSSISYLNEKMAGTKYTIKANIFKIESKDNTTEISSPKYVKEEIPSNVTPLSDVHVFIGNDVKCQYSIRDKDGNKTKWRLYVSTDCLWIASYVDNTANGSEIIMEIFKLSK